MKNFLDCLNTKGSTTVKAQDYYMNVVAYLDLQLNNLPSEISILKEQESYFNKRAEQKAVNEYETLLGSLNAKPEDLVEAQLVLDNFSVKNPYTPQIEEKQSLLAVITKVRAKFPKKVEDVVVKEVKKSTRATKK